MPQQMPLPLTISCSSKSRLVLPFLVLPVPFRYVLTWVVPDKFQKSSKTIVYVYVDRTWSGPAWSPALSLSSLLISIQSLMNEKPYHNEPGFEQVIITYTLSWYKVSKYFKYVTHTHKHNCCTALWILSGTTQVSRYQNKRSPTHTHCVSSVVSHLPHPSNTIHGILTTQSMHPTVPSHNLSPSFPCLPLCLAPSTSHSTHLTQPPSPFATHTHTIAARPAVALRSCHPIPMSQPINHLELYLVASHHTSI